MRTSILAIGITDVVLTFALWWYFRRTTVGLATVAHNLIPLLVIAATPDACPIPSRSTLPPPNLHSSP